MDLLHIRYFQKVAELGNMTRASEELHVAQPAISKIVKNLETEVGYPLFNRVGKFIELNQNGKIFLKYTNQVFQSLNDAQLEIHDYNQSYIAPVRILLTEGSRLFPNLLTQFKLLYPNIRLNIRQDPGAQFDQDLHIYSGEPVTTLAPTVECILEEQINLVVPISHRLSLYDSVSFSEMYGENFIGLETSGQLRNFTDSYCLKSAFIPDTSLEVDNSTMVLDLVYAGLGVAFYPEFSWGPIDTDRGKIIKVNASGFKRCIYISYPSDKYISNSVKVFKNFAVSFFRERKWLKTPETGIEEGIEYGIPMESPWTSPEHDDTFSSYGFD